MMVVEAAVRCVLHKDVRYNTTPLLERFIYLHALRNWTDVDFDHIFHTKIRFSKKQTLI